MNIDDLIGKVHNCDCLDFMRKLPDKCIDLVPIDPPYGIDYQSNMRTVTDKFDKIENDKNNMRFETYKKYIRLLKDDSIVVVLCSFKNYAYDYIELKKYFNIRNCIIWHKQGGGIGDLEHSLSTDYEMAIVCHNGNGKIRGKRVGSVWNIQKVTPFKMLHPTEKPVDLMMRIIDKFSDKNNIIFDPFLGSGTTAVACERLGRQWIGCEISPEYCKIAEERIKREKDQLKFKL